MSNNGGGQPLTFRCTKCKTKLYMDRNHGLRTVVTGRVKPLTKQQVGTGGGRVMQFLAQYLCLECGFVGWSRHQSLQRKLLLRAKREVGIMGRLTYEQVQKLEQEYPPPSLPSPAEILALVKKGTSGVAELEEKLRLQTHIVQAPGPRSL